MPEGQPQEVVLVFFCTRAMKIESSSSSSKVQRAIGVNWRRMYNDHYNAV